MAIAFNEVFQLSSNLESTLPLEGAVLYRMCWNLYIYTTCDASSAQERSYEVATMFALMFPNSPQEVISIGGGVDMADYWRVVERLSASEFGQGFKEHDGRELRDALVTSGGNVVTYHTGGSNE